MASEQSLLYGGFRESEIDIPTYYELHAMETQVKLEEMRDDRWDNGWNHFVEKDCDRDDCDWSCSGVNDWGMWLLWCH